MKRVVVIGGGISGLATAWFLRRYGASAIVLEAAADPGGTIRTIERDGFLVDAGPTSTLVRGAALDDLIAGAGLHADVVEADRRAPRYVVKDGKLVALPMSPADFVRTRLFSARAKWRLLAEPLWPRARTEESIAQFTRRRIGPEFLDWAVDPFVSGVYAGDPERLSVRAATARLYALEKKYGSLFIGALAQMFRGGAAGTQPRGRLISFRRGMQTLPRAIARILGDSLQLHAEATSIARAGDDWIVRAAGREFRAAAVVLALPAYAAADLVAPLNAELARELRDVYYPPVASVALGFARNQVGHALDGFGALLPRRAGRDTLGAIFSSSLFPGRAPPDKVLLTAFIGGARNPAVAALDDGGLVDRVSSDLGSLLAIRGEPMFRSITRWQYAIPQYELGHAQRIERIDALLATAEGLWVCANWRGGVSLADCVSSAAQVANALAPA